MLLNLLYEQMRVKQIRYRLNDEKTYDRLLTKALYDQVNYGLSGREDMYNMLCTMMVKEESGGVKRTRGKEYKKKLEQEIHRIEGDIKRSDTMIVLEYHCRVLCDRYGDDRQSRQEYYDFVRKMPQGYSQLRGILVDVVYPKFLREEHKHNPVPAECIDILPSSDTCKKQRDE